MSGGQPTSTISWRWLSLSGITRRRLSGVHQVSKEVIDGDNVGVSLVLWPPEGHALPVCVVLRVVGVDERISPKSLTDTSAISVDVTVRGVCVCVGV